MKDIVFIGAGNLATNLAYALFKKGFRIVQVYSRTSSSAVALAESVEADATDDPSEVIADADIYFVALKDDVIKEVLGRLRLNNNLIVHTAGSVPMDVLASFSDNYGVLYPVQTFSKNRKVDFSSIPVCLEANNKNNYKVLEKIAGELTTVIHALSSEQRLYLHIGAVFACNFTNFMFTGAENVMEEKGIPFHILMPLIKETVEKAGTMSPSEAQTGPARRRDRKTLDKHLKLLSDSELFQNLYRFVSIAIMNYYTNNKDKE